MRTKKLLTILTLIATLAATGALPAVLLAVPEAAPTQVSAELAQPSGWTLPPFPEDAARTPTDWASVDWNKEIIMEEDREAYYRELDRLEAEGRLGEVKNIALPRKRRLSDLAVMERRGVPEAVREVVREQVEADGLHDGGANTLSARLRALAPLTIGNADQQSSGTLMPPEQRLDIRDAKPLDLRAVGSVPPLGPNDMTITMPQRAVEQQSNTLPTLQRPQSRLPRKILQSDGSWLYKLARIIMPAAQAYYEPTTPLISYYDSIEDDPVAYALYSLSQNQNDDGSWGTADRYALTARIALALSDFNLAANDQYAQAVAFLAAHEPATVREAAVKVRLLAGLGEPYADLLDTVRAAQNNDGGFGLQAGYPSDLETTLEVLWALYAANETGELAPVLAYVLESVSDDGSVRYHPEAAPSYHLVTKTARYLAPLREASYEQNGVTIYVQDTVNRLLGFLAARYDAETAALAQTDDVVDMLTTLAVWQTYDTQTDAQAALAAQARERQLFDGGFGTLPATAAALEALARPDVAVTQVASMAGLVNQAPAELQVTLANQGYAPTGALRLYLFVDGFKINDGYDLTGSGLQLEPQETTTITLSLNAGFMERLTGDTDITMYVEAGDDVVYDNNWLEQTFSVSPAADGTPALPVYYIAFKHEISGQPAFNVRWAKKADPLRLNYIVTFREQGTSQWFYWPIHNDASGVFLGDDFEEGVTYEVAPGVVHLGAQTYTAFSDFTTITMSADEVQYTGNVAGVATVDADPVSGVHTWGYGVSDTTDSSGNFYYYNSDNGVNAAWIDEDYYQPFITRFPVTINATTTDVRLFTRLKPDTEAPEIDYFELQFVNSGTVRNQQTRKLFASFSDNVAVKEVDFYYRDPADEIWRYIGTQLKSPSGAEAIMDWYVPSELLGDGYQVRAIAYDWQGNASAPVEWGPFTIVDGTLPTGTATVSGLADGAWPLGETKTVSWEITAANQLTGMLYVRLRPSGATIASVPVSANGSAEYTLPLNASYLHEAATVDVSACDVNSNCVTLVSEPFAITDETPPPQYPWNTPGQVAALTNTLNLSRYLEKAFSSADGSRELLYREFTPAEVRLLYRRFDGSAWEDAILLDTGDTSINYRDISAARADDGSMHVVYQRTVSGDLTALDLAEVYHAMVRNGTATLTQVSNDSTNSRNPNLAVHADGRVSVSWRQGYSYGQQTGTAVLYHRERAANGAWGGTTQLTTTSTGNSAAVLDGDSFTVVYNAQDNQLMVRQQQGLSWSAPVVVATVYNVNSLKLFGRGPGGYDLFYWHATADTNWQYNVYLLRFSVDYPGQSALGEEPVSLVSLHNANDIVRFYDVAARGDGSYHLAYIQRVTHDSGYDTHAYHSLIDGAQAYFTTRVSAVTTPYLEETVTLNARDDLVEVYFRFGPQSLYNTADYRAVIDYRLDAQSPADGASVGTPAHQLRWTTTGGPVDSYEVRLGMAPDALTVVASELTAPETVITGLSPETDYYWQVVGSYTGRQIYGNIWAFSTGANIAPNITLQEPATAVSYTGQPVTITWTDDDPDNDAAVSLFYDSDTSGADGTLIIQNIAEDDETDSYAWDPAGLAPGTYYVYAIIDDSLNPPVTAYGSGAVTIPAPTGGCLPPAAGDWTVTADCTLQADATAPADVIVTNDAVLTVSAGATLYLDLSAHRLLVEQGSGVLIKNGGAIRRP